MDLELDPDVLADVLDDLELEQNDENFVKEFNFRVEFVSMYYYTFTTDQGQKVLKHLIKSCLLTPTVYPNDTEFAAGIRQGRADIVRFILEMLQRQRTGDYNVTNPQNS